MELSYYLEGFGLGITFRPRFSYHCPALLKAHIGPLVISIHF